MEHYKDNNKIINFRIIYLWIFLMGEYSFHQTPRSQAFCIVFFLLQLSVFDIENQLNSFTEINQIIIE